MQQSISKKYSALRDSLSSYFPSAHAFMLTVERGASDGLWISTSTNAHLYKHSSFLSYIRFGNPRHVTPKLIFSPNLHISIVRGTSDASCLLFPAAIREMLERRASAGSWRELHDDSIEISHTVSPLFFDDLFKWLQRLEVSIP